MFGKKKKLRERGRSRRENVGKWWKY